MGVVVGVEHVGPDVDLATGDMLADDLDLAGNALPQQSAHIFPFACPTRTAHADLVHVQKDPVGMKVFGQGLRLAVEDFVQFGLAHANRNLGRVDDHGMIPAHQEFLAVMDAAVGKDAERRRRPVRVVEIKLRIFQGSEVLVLRESDLAIFALDGDWRARPAEDVQRADLFDGEVVEPEPARFPAPDAGIEIDFVVIEAVDQHAEFPPVAGAVDIELSRGQFPAVGQRHDLKGMGRLEVLRLDPDADTIATMGPDVDLLHHAAVAMRVGGEVLHAERGRTGVSDHPIGKADHAGLVVEVVALEAVLRDLLERRVGQLHRGVWDEAGLRTLDQEGGVDDRDAFREHAVEAKSRTAVADGEYGRNQFQLEPAARLLDLTQPAKVVGRAAAEAIEARGEHGPIDAMPYCRFQNLIDLDNVRILGKGPAKDPDEPVRVLACGSRGGGNKSSWQKDQDEQRSHGFTPGSYGGLAIDLLQGSLLHGNKTVNRAAKRRPKGPQFLYGSTLEHDSDVGSSARQCTCYGLPRVSRMDTVHPKRRSRQSRPVIEITALRIVGPGVAH